MWIQMLSFFGGIMNNPFHDLNKEERILYRISLIVVGMSCLLSPIESPLIIVACFVGVTALIFVAKGYVIGQLLTAIFAVLYGMISYDLQYYGEMITYLGMSAPIALLSAYTWWKHPYQHTKEVEVYRLRKKDCIVTWIFAFIVTFVFFNILKLLHTREMFFSTLSVTTSFLACYLTYLRSPYYALGYAANDIILIILWSLASLKDARNIPMIFCFVMFLVNDFYGFINWKRMSKRQII